MRRDIFVEPFLVIVSSHGRFVIVAMEVPYFRDSSLPGLLMEPAVERLNEYWVSGGQPPFRLEANDDGMPMDLGDSRLDHAVRSFVEEHREALESAYVKAKSRWEVMREADSIVQGKKLRPGQAVECLLAKNGVRSEATVEFEARFVHVEGNKIYLEREGSLCSVAFEGGGTWRRWIEPVT